VVESAERVNVGCASDRAAGDHCVSKPGVPRSSRGGRFLINTVLDDDAAPITLLMNWNPEAKK
jgi:hypothetical protein